MSNSQRAIYIATLPDGSFGGAGPAWKTLGVSEISDILYRYGYGSVVVKINDLRSLNLNKNDVVFYTSSDEPSIRGYIKDFFYFVSQCCVISPSYEILLSHENKGFQQLYREWLDFGDLDGGYIFDLDDVKALLKERRALVYKTVGGAGSNGVSLVRSALDLKRIHKKEFSASVKRRIIKMQRKLVLTDAAYKIYAYRHKGFSLGVWQEFISGLECDYKVLVFGDRYFVLKRSVRRGDFRASGSGDFHFVMPPHEVLDYAKSVFESLNSPYASLDVALSKERCSLIEFQCLNFGPYTMLNSKVYYQYKAGEWTSVGVNFSLEDCFAHSMAWYLERYTCS